MSDAIRVDGLRELSAAFARADRDVRLGFRKSLREAAEPVRRDAESLAASGIRNVDGGDPWSRMRVGVTRSLVYVAPKQRGASRGDRSRRRPKFADLLQQRALDPALEQNVDQIVDTVDGLLIGVAGDWGRL